jgi:hypothetical protein
MSASSFSPLPAGIGLADVGMVAVLVHGGLGTGRAGSCVLCYRLISVALVVAVGWLVCAAAWRRSRHDWGFPGFDGGQRSQASATSTTETAEGVPMRITAYTRAVARQRADELMRSADDIRRVRTARRYARQPAQMSPTVKPFGNGSVGSTT